ncbi:MAG: Ig-like domain-containing protein, partial [Candidatus Delongbacteria bacterium]|nr:Ig-like domain-containing protein [Candidatus Delongbacteria bacterium]
MVAGLYKKMKRTYIYLSITLFILSLIILISCSKDNTTAPKNNPPSISITAPADSTEHPIGTDITITAEAQDTDGKVSEVIFFFDGTEISKVTDLPFNTILNTTGKSEGFHTISAEAKDDDSGTTWDSLTVKLFFPPNITVTSPNGSESWQAGSIKSVTWTDNIPGNVKIELYKGGIQNSVISASTVSTGSYNWTILSTQTPGTDYKIRITSIDTPTLFDESNANFSITEIPNNPPVINSITANPNSVYPNGTSTIVCAATDSDGDNISYAWDKTGGSITGTGSSVTWTAPAATGTFYIKCTATDGEDIDKDSVSVTVNEAPYITITAPNGTESWSLSTTHTITWSDNISENVNIKLYKGGIFNRDIAVSTASDGNYDWTIPTDLITDTDYSVKIESISDNAINDESSLSIHYDINVKVVGSTYLPNMNGGTIGSEVVFVNKTFPMDTLKTNLDKDGIYDINNLYLGMTGIDDVVSTVGDATATVFNATNLIYGGTDAEFFLSNVKGEKIKGNMTIEKGDNYTTVLFNPNGLSKGVYFYTIQSKNDVKSVKIVYDGGVVNDARPQKQLINSVQRSLEEEVRSKENTKGGIHPGDVHTWYVGITSSDGSFAKFEDSLE